jgi:hypothetical protein
VQFITLNTTSCILSQLVVDFLDILFNYFKEVLVQSAINYSDLKWVANSLSTYYYFRLDFHHIFLAAEQEQSSSLVVEYYPLKLLAKPLDYSMLHHDLTSLESFVN